MWTSWANVEGRGVAVADAENGTRVARQWIAESARQSDPRAAALSYGAQRAQTTEQELQAKLHSVSRYDRQVLFDRMGLANPSASVLGALLAAEGTTRGNAPHESVDVLLSHCDAKEAVQLLQELCALVGLARMPALVLRCGGNKSLSSTTAAVGLLGHLALSVPELPTGLVADSDTLEAVLETVDDWRVTDLLREGLLREPSSNERQPVSAPVLEPSQPAPDPGHSGAMPSQPAPEPAQSGPVRSRRRIERLTGDESAARAHVTLGNALDPQAASPDRARSEAERILFACLEALPDTRGLFGLNQTIPAYFGPRPAEIDLLASSLAVALEVDGPHHFHDREAYRRDRRKDRLLQSHGFFVVRVLAEDVYEDIDSVLDTIVSCVTTRRQELAQGEGS